MLSRVCRHRLPTPVHSSLLIQLYPDGDFSQEMELDSWARNFQPESPASQASTQKVPGSSRDTSPLQPSIPNPRTPGSYSDDSAYDTDSETSLEQNEVLQQLRKFSITPNSRRYFGKSSGISLLHSAMSAKHQAASHESPGVDPEPRVQRRHDFWNMRPVCLSLSIILFSYFLIDLSGSVNAFGLPSGTMIFLSQIFFPA